MKAMNIEALFNVPYSPQNNPIETVFSLIKHSFKKMRLERLAKGKSFEFKNGVMNAVSSLNNDQVKHICRRVSE
jgi:hypothetical protein